MYEKLFLNVNIYGSNQTAMLVRGEKIAAVGSIAECRAIAHTNPQSIDCRGSYITPGFTDSHCHLVEAGETFIRPVLAGLSTDELVSTLESTNSSETDGKPMIAMGLDDTQFQTLRDSPEFPVSATSGALLFHQSGHSALADRAATQVLNVPSSTGEVTLIEDPYEIPQVLNILQERKHQDEYLSICLDAGISNYLQNGITSLQDNTWDPEVFRLMVQMTRGIDIQSWVKGDDPLSAWTMGKDVLLPEHISTGPVKFFIDGAFFNQMAWLTEPYNGTNNYGDGLQSEDIARRITPFIAGRKQCIFHAAGDRAISELCDALESLLPEYPWIPELRIRIEHAQLIHERDFERIRNLGMVISVQPDACANPERDIRLLGKERAERAYPHKRILDEGIPLAFGSDFPYESSIDPFAGIHAVCNRTLGKSLSPEQAIQTFSQGGAFAGFDEKQKGKIEQGLQADFFISDSDPLRNPYDARDTIQAVYNRGLCVYTSNRN